MAHQGREREPAPQENQRIGLGNSIELEERLVVARKCEQHVGKKAARRRILGMRFDVGPVVALGLIEPSEARKQESAIVQRLRRAGMFG